MDVDLPSQALRDHWDDLVADLEATAAELEAADWDALALHVGDVTTATTGDPPGLDVLVPHNEYKALVETVSDGAAFDETAVYRRAAGGVTFLLFVLRDPGRRAAVLIPAFYPQRGDDAAALAEHAHTAGVVHVLVRPLERDRAVTFAIDDPDLVFPDDWG